MTMSTHTRQSLRWMTTALALPGCPSASFAQAPDCPGDYQIVDYFKPDRSDYVKFAFQGGFALSLCNRPHETYSAEQVYSKGCNNIDLKGYLFLPGGGGASPADAVDPIVSTRHTLAADRVLRRLVPE